MEQDALIFALADSFGLPKDLHARFAAAVRQVAGTMLIPETWEEAKALQPGLMKWDEARAKAKADGRKLTIIDHLRDTETGYGRWVLREPGLPRPVLLRCDYLAYFALGKWLGNNAVPDDMHLPSKSGYIDKLAAATGLSEDKLSQIGQALGRRQQRRRAARAQGPAAG